MKNKLIEHNEKVLKNKTEREEILKIEDGLIEKMHKSLSEIKKIVKAPSTSILIRNGKVEIIFHRFYLSVDELCSIEFNVDFTKIKPRDMELELAYEIIETIKGVVCGD